MRRKKTIWLAVLLSLVAGLVLWLRERPTPQQAPRPTAAAAPAQPSPRPATVSPPVAATAPLAVPAPASVPVDSARSRAALKASERMYAAHAPLRTAEVANPDSTTNRRILQTMVEKALAEQSGPADAPSTTKH